MFKRIYALAAMLAVAMAVAVVGTAQGQAGVCSAYGDTDCPPQSFWHPVATPYPGSGSFLNTGNAEWWLSKDSTISNDFLSRIPAPKDMYWTGTDATLRYDNLHVFAVIAKFSRIHRFFCFYAGWVVGPDIDGYNPPTFGPVVTVDLATYSPTCSTMPPVATPTPTPTATPTPTPSPTPSPTPTATPTPEPTETPTPTATPTATPPGEHCILLRGRWVCKMRY